MNRSSFFGFDAPKDRPGLVLWQTTITWQKLIKEALEPYNISHSQYVIMAILLWFEENDEEINQIKIAAMSRLDKMTVSDALKKLSKIGLIERREHAKDTRAKVATLTQRGKELACKLVPIVEGVDARFFGRLAKKDQAELMRILGEISLLAEVVL